MQQFGSRKNVGAASSSDFLRAKRINAIRAAGDIKANTATSGYEPMTIVQFNSVVQSLNNVSFKEGGAGGGGNVPVPEPPLPPVGDNSFVFQVGTQTAVFSFDSVAPSVTDISWGGSGSLFTVVDVSQTTYQYTYSDGNPTHNVTMSNVTNVQEVSIYQTPRPVAPAFTISGVTPTALDTYTLHISPVAGATSYFLALNGTPTTIIQPSVNLSYEVAGICGRTYTNAFATMKQGRIGDFSAAQSYSIPALPQPSVSLTATSPTTFTATVSSSVLPGAKRVFEIYQLSGGVYSIGASGQGTTYSLTGAFNTNQSVYANLVYNMHSTISSTTGSVLLPNTIVWDVPTGTLNDTFYYNLDINQSTGTIIVASQNIITNSVSIYRTINAGETFQNITDRLENFSSRFIFIKYLTDNTWFITCSKDGGLPTSIYKTTDDGITWSNPYTFDNLESLKTIATNNQSDIVIGGNGGFSTTSGLYYSSNRGNTWVSGVGIVPNSNTTADIRKVVYTPCAWFAMGRNAQNTDPSAPFTGLVYSENGINWKPVSGAFPSQINYLPTDLGTLGEFASETISFDPSNHLWVLAKEQYTLALDSTLMWSTNASEWYPATSGAPHISDINTGDAASTSVLYTNNTWLTTGVLRVGSIFSDTSSILRSTDGKNWVTVQQARLPLPFGIAINSSINSFVAYGTHSTIGNINSNSTLYSIDGNNWIDTAGDAQNITTGVVYDTSHDKWISAGTFGVINAARGFVTT